jgi:hypothetical protein
MMDWLNELKEGDTVTIENNSITYIGTVIKTTKTQITTQSDSKIPVKKFSKKNGYLIGTTICGEAFYVPHLVQI